MEDAIPTTVESEPHVGLNPCWQRGELLQGPSESLHSPRNAGNTSQGFTFVFVSTFLLLSLTALAINVLGNDNGAFPSPLFPSELPAAKESRELEALVQTGAPPEALIFGSSRVMGIETGQLQAITGLQTFNYGVYGAQPAIYLAQLRYALRLGVRPKVVILGVDEFSFGEKNPLGQMDLQMTGDIGLFREVAFPDNLEIAARQLKSMRPMSTWHSLVRLLRVDKSKKSQDFGWSPDAVTLEARISEHAKKLFGDHPGDDLIESTRVCRRKIEDFREFLALSEAHGAEVRVVLLPMHPEFERLVLTRGLVEVREELHRQLGQICAEFGAIYMDFRKLDRYHGDASEFTDGTHQTSVNLRRMTNVLFGKDPETPFATRARENRDEHAAIAGER